MLKKTVKTLSNLLSDKTYIRLRFFMRLKRFPDLNNPKTLNEKLQWLKLNDRNPMYPTLVDKYDVKEYVTGRIGEEYVIPALGVWDRFEDIDFATLPDRFVLKCTHDSGGLVICRDKSSLDLQRAKEKIERSLKTNYYRHGREWPYKNLKHRIIAEPYVEDYPGSGTLTDYKFYCFGGKVDSVMLCIDRETGDTKFYFFDRDWNLKRYNKRGKEAPENFTLPKPKNMDRMFALAETLSQGIPFVRLDMYNCDGQIYFGEYTLYPSGGFDPNRLPESDLYFGSLITMEK